MSGVMTSTEQHISGGHILKISFGKYAVTAYIETALDCTRRIEMSSNLSGSVIPVTQKAISILTKVPLFGLSSE